MACNELIIYGISMIFSGFVRNIIGNIILNFDSGAIINIDNMDDLPQLLRFFEIFDILGFHENSATFVFGKNTSICIILCSEIKLLYFFLSEYKCCLTIISCRHGYCQDITLGSVHLPSEGGGQQFFKSDSRNLLAPPPSHTTQIFLAPPLSVAETFLAPKIIPKYLHNYI